MKKITFILLALTLSTAAVAQQDTLRTKEKPLPLVKGTNQNSIPFEKSEWETLPPGSLQIKPLGQDTTQSSGRGVYPRSRLTLPSLEDLRFKDLPKKHELRIFELEPRKEFNPSIDYPRYRLSPEEWAELEASVPVLELKIKCLEFLKNIQNAVALIKEKKNIQENEDIIEQNSQDYLLSCENAWPNYLETLNKVLGVYNNDPKPATQPKY